MIPSFIGMTEFKPALEKENLKWFSAREYQNPIFIAKGKSGAIWKVEKDGAFFAAKIEHEHSTRKRMIEQETQLLRMANQVNVGPKLYEVDFEAGILLMEYIEGIPLADWIETVTSKIKIEKVLTRLFAQTRKLDNAGIDHGQLGGKLHNIMIGPEDRVVILDFEKASYVRGVHNGTKVRDVLLGNRTIYSKKLHEVWPNLEEDLDL